SLIGNPGQGNYASANAFLDGLALYRVSAGLPALTINWGALGEVGVAAMNEGVSEHLEHIGIKAISLKQTLLALEYLLRSCSGQMGVFDLDWDRSSEYNHVIKDSNKYSTIKTKTSVDDTSDDIKLKTVILSVPIEERLGLMESLVGEQVAKILGLPQERLDIHQPINNLGVDSLMTVEVVVSLRSIFGVEYSTMEILKGISVSMLAANLLERLGLQDLPQSEDMLLNIDKLSEDKPGFEVGLRDLPQSEDMLSNIDKLSEDKPGFEGCLFYDYKLRVTFGMTNAEGNVSHDIYASLFGSVRENLGLEYIPNFAKDVVSVYLLKTRNARYEYIKDLFFGDQVTVRMWVSEIKAYGFILESEYINVVTDEVHAIASQEIVYASRDGIPKELPIQFREILEGFLSESKISKITSR
ncbi:MAG: KR domain-containing protein, partial [Candidatus Magnetobacterium sp. LHC-1]